MSAPDAGPASAGQACTGDVHVWWMPLDVARPLREALAAALTADERTRAARFRRPLDRDRWSAMRGWQRRLLAGYLGVEPASLRFATGGAGKPRLTGADAWLRFSASRSDGLAAFAVAAQREVGIDIERLAGDDPVPRRALTDAEHRRLDALGAPARARTALQLWTGKEALLKALGCGLAVDPASVDAGALLDAEPVGRWVLRALDAGRAHVAAICAEGPAPRVVSAGFGERSCCAPPPSSA